MFLLDTLIHPNLEGKFGQGGWEQEEKGLNSLPFLTQEQCISSKGDWI